MSVNITQMDIINAQIEYGSKGTANKDITRNILHEWRNSETIDNMIEAEKYLRVENTEIEKKSRNYYDENDNIIENKNVSNVKSKTAQYRKSVKQKYNFALAKPFIISCDNKKYKEEWENFLTNKIRAVIQRTGKAGINKGISWIYPWINELGDLEIVDVLSETVYPAWKDEAHTELDVIVRDYIVTKYENLSPTDIRKVEFWDSNVVEKYVDYGNGDLSADIDETSLENNVIVQQSHMVTKDNKGISWDRVPFIAFKGCDDELPLLNECKTDIDSYDLIKSKAIDSILDDIDAILVVENISPEIKELTKARKMVQNSRIMSVDTGGNAHFEKVNTDITAIAQKLEILKKDIQDNTSTVDLTTIQLGTNPSGQSMKSFYESLNIWCNGFETEFRICMENLKYFFDKWLSWKGGFGTFERLQEIPITFTLDRDMMINETEIIDNIVKMQDKISQETLDEMNPWVENHQKEQERRDNEEKEMQKKDELYNFNDDIEPFNNEDDNIEESEQK